MTKVNLGKDTSGRPLILDDTTLAKVRWAEAQLGWSFALIQGSYMAGISSKLSGGTHDAGGAVDLRTWDLPANVSVTRALTVLRQAGLIAWYRWQSAFPDHEIHALDYGNPGLSPAARDQVTAYLAGRNGLSGALSGPDDGPKVTVPKEVPPMAARIDGADISHYQGGVLDFAAARKAGVRWVYHKATEGTTLTDARYAGRRAEVAAARLLFGGYHFARPASSNGTTQAKFFLSVARPKPGDMRPMLDFEDDGNLSRKALTSWVGDFVAEVIRQTGQPPMLYNKFDLDEHFDCPLWVARYSDRMTAPVVPAPWKQWTVWQFSNGVAGKPNSVAGLGAVDLNTMNGDPAQLTAAFTLGAVPPDPKKDWFTMATKADLTAAVQALIPDIAAAVLAAEVPNASPGTDKKTKGSVGGMLTNIEYTQEDLAGKVNARLDALAAQLTALTTLVQELAGVGPDVAAIRAEVEKDATSA